jgi:glycosyltransferase involved in cell wall biosynthesis
LEELRTLIALRRIYNEHRPDIVHHVTIKPVIYGTNAARWSGVHAVVNAVPGMGFVFTQRGLLARIRRLFVVTMYRAAMSHPNMRVIFQNKDDMQDFVRKRIVDPRHAVVIAGSGVDLERYRFLPEPETPVTFVLVGRMLRHKGIVKFVDAARRVKRTHPDWRFLLVGDVDEGNPSSLMRTELEGWSAAGDVEWLGQREDVADLIAAAHVVVLPSFREGLPKTLLEAAASGRAMIASDIAGCRMVVSEGVTGLLVPVADSGALADAMLQLGNDGALRERLGRSAREKAEALFSVEDVVRDTFLVYEQLN